MQRSAGTRRQPSGFIRLKVLVTLAVVAALGYLGTKLGPPYWDYLSMQDPVKEAAMAFSRRAKEADVRAELIGRAKALGVALEEENVDIGQQGNFAVVRVSWDVPVDIPLYRRTLHFQVEHAVPAP